MALPVLLRRVVNEIEALMDECTAHLNRDTAELYTVRGEEAAAAEGALDPHDLPDRLVEELPTIREILESDVFRTAAFERIAVDRLDEHGVPHTR